MISEDELSAELVLPPLRGKPPVDFQATVKALVERHRIVDVDREALHAGLEAAGLSDDAPVRCVIATGEPAVGEDGTIEWLGAFFESQAIHMPNGAVDHYHHTKVSVYEGQPLVQIHPPTGGRPGRTVCGGTIKPVPGQPAKLEFDDSVRPDERTPDVLCAARAGMVECYRDRLTVSEVQIVDAVDFATGSIDFEGAVQVRNTVAPKFSVVGTAP